MEGVSKLSLVDARQHLAHQLSIVCVRVRRAILILFQWQIFTHLSLREHPAKKNESWIQSICLACTAEIETRKKNKFRSRMRLALVVTVVLLSTSKTHTSASAQTVGNVRREASECVRNEEHGVALQDSARACTQYTPTHPRITINYPPSDSWTIPDYQGGGKGMLV